MKKIAVYGSLRQGMYNHPLLRDSKFLETKEIEVPYKMVSFRYYPALIPSEKKNKIIVEIYEVDNDVYKDVEALEGYPNFYNRVTLDDDSEIYVLSMQDDYYDSSHYEYEEHIKDWVEYSNQQRENNDYQQ